MLQSLDRQISGEYVVGICKEVIEMQGHYTIKYAFIITDDKCK